MKTRQVVRLILSVCVLLPLATHGAYFSQVMSHNPLLYYRLGESSGPTATDSSVNAYHGTYFGTNEFAQTGALLLDSNTAVRFRGDQGPARVDSPVTTFNPTAPWTITLWIKPENVGESKGIVSQKDGTGTGRSLIYQSYDGSGSYFASFLGGSEWGWGGGYISAFGTYLHLALVYNGSGGLQWYTNGLPAASHSGISAEAANGAFVIASFKDNSGPLRGTLDEVAIFQTALSSGQILDLYNSFDDPPIVPEPSTVFLLVVGGTLLWQRRRLLGRDESVAGG
ncbi:MAG: LamG domain-containing protein [Verrucomicrobiae bacterium]|nr:LamG domain-containing protein [Verrucomicrobiae bacterium]